MSEMNTMNIPTLRDKAVLVRVSRSMYVPSMCDRTATEIAETALQAGKKSGRFIKKLLVNCKELKDCQRAFQDVYKFYVDNSLPWMDEGMRILPNENINEFGAELARLRDNAYACVDALASVWDDAIEADKLRLGGMFNSADYPSASAMRQRWDVRVMFIPVPASDDFRVGMDDLDKQKLDDAVRQAQQESTDYLLRQLLAPMQAMANKLQVPIGTEGSIFRDTLVTNLQDVAKQARSLNINDDSRISELCDEIESALSVVDANTLRTCESARNVTATKMKSLTQKASQWF